jgi:monoterpene epsilon-lactone hydrolase
MASLQMRVISGVLRLTRKPRTATVERARERIAAPKGSNEPPAALRSRHDVRTRQVQGFPCTTVAPRDGATGRAVVYLHGGSYTGEIATQHWALISKFADAGVRVEVPLYGLAPQHTYREAYPFVTEVYRDLLAEVDPSLITIAGDSAGGGLALGFAQTLAAEGLPQPRRLVLLSPWLDLTLSHPDLPALEPRDPWLNIDGTIEAGKVWAGGDDPTQPKLSPINGQLSGLAPMDVTVGTHELCLPDVLLLQERATAAGAQLCVTVCPGAVHVYPLVPAPEGRAEARRIVEEIARG